MASGGATCEKRETVTASEPRSGRRKPLDAAGFQPEISSFRLHLAAEGKSAKTVRTYTEAVQWFAALTCSGGGTARAGKKSPGRICRTWSPGCWAGTARRTPATSTGAAAVLHVADRRGGGPEPDDPDAAARVPEEPVPVFTGDEIARLEQACAGRGFRDRRDAGS